MKILAVLSFAIALLMVHLAVSAASTPAGKRTRAMQAHPRKRAFLAFVFFSAGAGLMLYDELF